MGSANSSEANRFWFCPLYSFDCYSESVELIENIHIKQITPEFKRSLQERWIDLIWLDPTNAKYGVTLPYRSVGGMLKKGDEESDLLVDLITALRLCHAGPVTPGPLRMNKLDGAADNQILPYISKYGADPFIFSEYQLENSDVPQVNKLLKDLIDLHSKNDPENLSIAIRRFNSSYSGTLENRLVDQMVAFEFLYLGYEQELKYKLALRVAFLLGKDDEELRKDIFDKMSEAYKVRSDIVHGNKQVEWSVLEEIIPQTEEFLRQSIKIFLSLLSEKHSFKRLREGTEKKLAELDENILKNGTLLA
jgi:hypothetical protein